MVQSQIIFWQRVLWANGAKTKDQRCLFRICQRTRHNFLAFFAIYVSFSHKPEVEVLKCIRKLGFFLLVFGENWRHYDFFFWNFLTFNKKKKQENCSPAGDSLDLTYFQGRSPNFSQSIQKNSYLIAQMPPSILCYNHKVASSTWMSTFAKLLGDQAYFQNLLETSTFYKWVENGTVRIEGRRKFW